MSKVRLRNFIYTAPALLKAVYQSFFDFFESHHHIKVLTMVERLDQLLVIFVDGIIHHSKYARPMVLRHNFLLVSTTLYY